jgi:2-polyprenyl-3-methyl-5-hydroxy-6-metoxy-1,4-benzoquinol methylase
MRIDKEKWDAAQVEELAFWNVNLASVDEVVANKAYRLATFASCLIWGSLGYFPNAFSEKRVIDIGCGPTARCSCFVRAELIGIDPLARDYDELPGNRMRSYYMTYALQAEETIPELNGTADVVVSLNCLDHCQDAEAVIRNMEKYLKPGGLGIISVDVLDSRINDPLHPLRMQPETIATLIEEAGGIITSHEQGRAYPHAVNGELAWQDGWTGGDTVAHHWKFRKAG